MPDNYLVISTYRLNRNFNSIRRKYSCTQLRQIYQHKLSYLEARLHIGDTEPNSPSLAE